MVIEVLIELLWSAVMGSVFWDAIAMRECDEYFVVELAKICVRLCVRALHSLEKDEDVIDRMCPHSDCSTLGTRLIWLENADLKRTVKRPMDTLLLDSKKYDTSLSEANARDTVKFSRARSPYYCIDTSI